MKKHPLLQNKLFQASVIISLVLISSAIFISQADKLFGKAATPVTGTLVLSDKLGDEWIWGSSFALPGNTCDVKVTAAGLFYTSSSGCGGAQAYVQIDNRTVNYAGSNGDWTPLYANFGSVSGGLHTLKIVFGYTSGPVNWDCGCGCGTWTNYGKPRTVTLAFSCT
jgi:hypothetical protein